MARDTVTGSAVNSMHLSILMLTLFLTALILPIGMTAVQAATIVPTSSDNCRLRLSGPIARGDFQNFLELAEQHFLGFDGEATSRDVICLDSPGGSLAEGVEFARHFYSEGVGTYIEDGAECHSACAIMFMMGLAEGSEVRFANRKMHIGGTLGFHRPYLAPNSTERIGLDATEIAALYDLALQSALDLIEVGNRKSPWSNKPMMMPDLIQQMLTHVGDEMFLVDNIDRAGRFQVDIVGLPKLRRLTEEQAFYACENALQWQVGLTDGDITYDLETAELYGGQRRAARIPNDDGYAAFHVVGLSAGYAGEGCVIVEQVNGIAGCGIDEYTGVTLGQGKCSLEDFETKLAPLDEMARHNPSTKLASFQGMSNHTPASYRCTVLNNQTIIDSDPCIADAHVIDEPGWPGALHAVFTWPSGATTILRRSDTRTEINGVSTSLRRDSRHGGCFFNSKTGNEFCFARAD